MRHLQRFNSVVTAYIAWCAEIMASGAPYEQPSMAWHTAVRSVDQEVVTKVALLVLCLLLPLLLRCNQAVQLMFGHPLSFLLYCHCVPA